MLSLSLAGRRGRELVCRVAEVHSECHYQRLQQSFTGESVRVK